MSHWPRGLFRRAYLRDYAAAIGASSEPLVAEFVRLFPEDGAPVDESTTLSAPEPMRLSFPDGRHVASQRALSSIAGAAAELAVVLAAGVGAVLRARHGRNGGLRRHGAGLLSAGHRGDGADVVQRPARSGWPAALRSSAPASRGRGAGDAVSGAAPRRRRPNRCPRRPARRRRQRGRSRQALRGGLTGLPNRLNAGSVSTEPA